MNNPNFKRQFVRHIAAGLQIDEKSRMVGYIDASNGVPWRCPDDLDLLAYSLGHAEGMATRACAGGAASRGNNKRGT